MRSNASRFRPAHITRRLARCLLAVFVMSGSSDPQLLWSADPARPGPGFDRPSGDSRQGRSAIVARHGIVATSHPLAAHAGLDALRAGGNAADAAIAASAVIGLTEPMSCGIGGDLFALYWDAKTSKLYGLNASGRSPYRLNRQVFADQGLKQIPLSGPLCWSVPGCVSGWGELHQRFGSRPWAELLEPAITHASDGFPITEIIGVDWRRSQQGLSKWPTTMATYFPGGRAPRIGELFRNPGLAKSLQAIAADGPSAFYTGPIAAEIVAYSQAHGGYFSREDFADHRAEWVEPISTSYRGYELWELPPNGQGLAALQMLNLLEPHDLKQLGHNSAPFIHLLVEAKKLAFADRARFYADPAFEMIPVAALASKEYAAQRGKFIDPHKAAVDTPPGDPRFEQGDTIYLTVVDKDRNCCSFIQSNFYGWGSQVVPGEVGFVLQNRGAWFALDDEHPNRLEPHKRPFHTIIPAMVTHEGRPWLCYGVMGGDMQPQGHVQVLINMVDFGMNVQAAGEVARVRHLGSAEPTGAAADPDGGSVAVEWGVSEAVREQLRRMGHRVVDRQAGAFGGYQGIWIDWQHGTLQGGSDPRKDGCAVGY